MSKKIVMLVSALLLFGSLAWAEDKSWVGTVSDSMCGAKHATASADAAACVAKCAAGGSKYVLVSDGKVYQVEPQDKFSSFAGKSVKVSGTMTGDAITATDVAAAEGKHKKAAGK